MPKKPLLSRDELDYIQQILGHSLSSNILPVQSFRVDGGSLANGSLAGLGRNAQLHLEAQFGDQCLRFPLQLVEDDFHALHLELGAPGIYQQGEIQRPWRLTLAQPLPLLHENGQASDLCIHEISPAGVLVESGEMSAPADFDLWLPLPEQDPIELHGSRVRRTTSQLTAFRLDILPSQQSERLRHFIFQQHRLQHPQLQQHCA